MKKFIFGLFVTSLLVASAASANQVIAFVDADAAILNSEPAKEKIAVLKARLAPDQDKVKDIEKAIRALQARIQQDSAVMSEAEKRKLNNDIELKIVEYQQRSKQLQEAQMASQQELMGELAPKFKQAVTQLMEENKYTILMHLKAALIVDQKDNLTKRVTEKINANP